MRVVSNEKALLRCLQDATDVSNDHPVVRARHQALRNLSGPHPCRQQTTMLYQFACARPPQSTLNRSPCKHGVLIVYPEPVLMVP